MARGRWCDPSKLCPHGEVAVNSRTARTVTEGTGGLSDKRAWRFRGGGARCFANSPFPLETSLLVLLKHRLRHVSAEYSCFSLYSLGFRSRLQRASPMQVT